MRNDVRYDSKCENLLILVEFHNSEPISSHFAQTERFRKIDEGQDILLEAGTTKPYRHTFEI